MSMKRVFGITTMCCMMFVCGCSDSSGLHVAADLDNDTRTAADSSGTELGQSDIDQAEHHQGEDVGIPYVLPVEPLVPVVLTDALPAPAEGLAFDDQGNLFLSSADGRIFRMPAGGDPEVYVDLLPVDEGLSPGNAGLAMGPDDALYVCRYGAGRIERVSLGQTPEVTIFLDDITEPNFLLFETGGTLWYSSSHSADGGPGHVARIKPDGDPEIMIQDIVYANGLALSPDGAWLYVNSSDPGSVLRVPLDSGGNPAGEPVVVAEGPDVTIADGLLMGPDGTLFIAAFGAGKIMALSGNDLTTVAEVPGSLELVGTASLAWGGPGFSPTAIYATNLLKPVVYKIELAASQTN